MTDDQTQGEQISDMQAGIAELARRYDAAEHLLNAGNSEVPLPFSVDTGKPLAEGAAPPPSGAPVGRRYRSSPSLSREQMSARLPAMRNRV